MEMSMAAHPIPNLTPEQYLEIERRAEFRSEYYRGVMYAMAGGSSAHSLIIVNFCGELRQAVKGQKCYVFQTDLRLRVSPAGLFTYPDMMVVCGDPAYADDRRDTVLNPILIVEVLSTSTERTDRGRKFADYGTLDSLREYVLVSQREPRIEIYRRQPNAPWLRSEVTGIDAILRIDCLDCNIPLAEIYDKVEFSES
jgi:Uma2 family endonuclease